MGFLEDCSRVPSQLIAIAQIATCQFADHHWTHAHPVLCQQLIESLVAMPQMIDPDRGIDKNQVHLSRVCVWKSVSARTRSLLEQKGGGHFPVRSALSGPPATTQISPARLSTPPLVQIIGRQWSRWAAPKQAASKPCQELLARPAVQYQPAQLLHSTVIAEAE